MAGSEVGWFRRFLRKLRGGREAIPPPDDLLGELERGRFRRELGNGRAAAFFAAVVVALVAYVVVPSVGIVVVVAVVVAWGCLSVALAWRRTQVGRRKDALSELGRTRDALREAERRRDAAERLELSRGQIGRELWGWSPKIERIEGDAGGARGLTHARFASDERRRELAAQQAERFEEIWRDLCEAFAGAEALIREHAHTEHHCDTRVLAYAESLHKSQQEKPADLAELIAVAARERGNLERLSQWIAHPFPPPPDGKGE